jgi:hypothetical protein
MHPDGTTVGVYPVLRGVMNHVPIAKATTIGARCTTAARRPSHRTFTVCYTLRHNHLVSETYS